MSNSEGAAAAPLPPWTRTTTILALDEVIKEDTALTVRYSTVVHSDNKDASFADKSDDIISILEAAAAGDSCAKAKTTVIGYRVRMHWDPDSVNLTSLEQQYGHDYCQFIYFHIAAFEINKACCLKPDWVSFGSKFAHFVTSSFRNLWFTILHHVWGQWRYENNLPYWKGPSVVEYPSNSDPAATAVPASVGGFKTTATRRALSMCGGGKDSLVTMTLLSAAGVPFDTCSYSHSIYGDAEAQHVLTGSLVDGFNHSCSHTTAEGAGAGDGAGGSGGFRLHHRQFVTDSFFDIASAILAMNDPGAPTHTVADPARIVSPLSAAPVTVTAILHEIRTHHPTAFAGVSTLCAAETPSSVFSSLPLLLLGERYTDIVVGHEASANRGNMTWAVTGEELNHQWGKGIGCEALLTEYIRTHIHSSVSYWSALAPINDVIIFQSLNEAPMTSLLHLTHSCNYLKPWCYRCPKCAYVWLGYAAHLPVEVISGLRCTLSSGTGGYVDVFHSTANSDSFARLLGQKDHSPFECIGEVRESCLAWELVRRKGYLGVKSNREVEADPRDIGDFIGEYIPTKVEDLNMEGRYDCNGSLARNIPECYRARVLEVLQRWSDNARTRLQQAQEEYPQ